VRELKIGRVIINGAVHPEYRRQGIGRRLLQTAMEHGRTLGAKIAHIPIARSLPSASHFARINGFRVARRFHQMYLITGQEQALALPPGFEIRHFKPGDEPDLCNLQNLAFSHHWGFHPNTADEISYLVNTSPYRPEGILFVSSGPTKVGYCWTAKHPVKNEQGLIQMIGVDPRYRVQGLGKALLLAGTDYLRKMGVKKVELVVDSKNRPARQLYQAVGFEIEDTILWHQQKLTAD
jgi:mycothiol synthase